MPVKQSLFRRGFKKKKKKKRSIVKKGAQGLYILACMVDLEEGASHLCHMAHT